MSSCASKSSSSTPVASSEKREKLTPSSSTVAPSGSGRPGSIVGTTSAIERRRRWGLLVDVALIELNDVPLWVRDPGDAHPLDELAHVERSESDLRVVPHFCKLRVEVVDEERDVTPAWIRRAIGLAAGRRSLTLRREQLEARALVADHHDLMGPRQIDTLPPEPEMLRVPLLHLQRLCARDAHVVDRRHRPFLSCNRSMIF